jgi:hypothetical protein
VPGVLNAPEPKSIFAKCQNVFCSSDDEWHAAASVFLHFFVFFLKRLVHI